MDPPVQRLSIPRAGISDAYPDREKKHDPASNFSYERQAVSGNRITDETDESLGTFARDCLSGVQLTIQTNVFVERLWRTVKYEEVYLKDYPSVPVAVDSLGLYFQFYNGERLHQSLGYRTPASVHYASERRS